MSTFEEIRPEFEISSKVENARSGALKPIYPRQDSGVVRSGVSGSGFGVLALGMISYG